MASGESQQTWLPYEPPKDCSMGLCSVYCPQWCYIIFPPPPPIEYSDGSSPTFSPLVIAIIGILASAFLLVSYYTIISKYCGTFDSLRQRLGGRGADGRELDNNLGQSHRHEDWNITPSDGLDQTLINKITICKYKKGDGFVDSTDCSVCLSEFREDESLRLLPKCSHAFHIQCIDKWLKSHSNCPLCRATIVPLNLEPLPPFREADSSPPVEEGSSGVVVAIEDLAICSEEENQLPVNVEQIHYDSGGTEESSAIIEIKEDDFQPSRPSFSLDSTRSRVSIADVLQMSMEDELLAAKENGLWVGTSSSRRCAGEPSKGSSRRRGLHCVMSPVPMKRSVSGGRFCLNRHGKGKNTVPPV